MKNLIFILMFLFPVVAFAQQPWYKSSPLEYAWKNVGNAGFSAGMVFETSLAFSPSGQPYVAFMDDGDSTKVRVMKFDGNSWVNVGNAGLPYGLVYGTSLAFSPSGEPYVAFLDALNYQKATVMKYDGTNWVYVGNAGFSEGEADFTSLAFSPSGQPYVAYTDGGNGGKASVMKYDGTNWGYFGNAGFSEGAAVYFSLAFSPSGNPYVSYADVANYQKATVMKYDSVYFGINELQETRSLVYPNPATDKITIEIAEGQAPGQLSMMNLNGEEILTCSLIKPKTQIDISNLPSGVYFVRLTNDKTVDVGKIVKE